MDYIYTYHVAKMDCPCEEQLVRMKLHGIALQSLTFDLDKRYLYVCCDEVLSREIDERLRALGLGAQRVKTEACLAPDLVPGQVLTYGITPHNGIEGEERSKVQRHRHREVRTLCWVLAINFALFLLEEVLGWLYGSMGLLADGLDMLADALVYGMSLWAVGQVASRQRQVAAFSGYIQMGLAFVGLFEVLRRFVLVDVKPNAWVMIFMSVVALVGNALCLHLLNTLRSDGKHIEASRIFSANDVIVNLGVIASGLLVYLTGSPYPDLVVGTLIFVLVFRGARQILALAH